jgi:hypothetical protein
MIEYALIALSVIPSAICMSLLVLAEKRRKAREAAEATARFITDSHFCAAVDAVPMEDIERLRQLRKLVERIDCAAKRKARGR